MFLCSFSLLAHTPFTLQTLQTHFKHCKHFKHFKHWKWTRRITWCVKITPHFCATTRKPEMPETNPWWTRRPWRKHWTKATLVAAIVPPVIIHRPRNVKHPPKTKHRRNSDQENLNLNWNLGVKSRITVDDQDEDEHGTPHQTCLSVKKYRHSGVYHHHAHVDHCR